MHQNKRHEQLLKNVTRPGRYTGGELNETVKELKEGDLRFCMCFPDTYEIGMSNLGIKILYSVINSIGYCSCERSFAPWPDMEDELVKTATKLYALESGDPLDAFDIIGFTLQYELSYTNVLNMLKLSKIPLLAKDRGEDDLLGQYPIVLGGGPCTYNPEPVAEFFDVFLIGEGEVAVVEFIDLYKKSIESKETKKTFLYKVAQLEGFYVPSLYQVEYNKDKSIKSIVPTLEGVPKVITKRVVNNLDEAHYPRDIIVPYLDVVHDRVILEVCRGCIRGCRFCQAGIVYRPYRERSPEVLNDIANESIKNTGYEEISLSSLSISDYNGLENLTDMLLDWTDKEKINLSLPSMRIDSFYEKLLEKAMSVRKSGVTFAPEAGTQRLRDVINKNISEEEILTACDKVFDFGMSRIKLYFMCGLPTETSEDILAINDLAEQIIKVFYSKPRKQKSVNLTLSLAAFVPKPFTPFQWVAQDEIETTLSKQLMLKDAIKNRKIVLKYHDSKQGKIESVFARGDRRLTSALLKAVDEGMKFDSWDEFFDYDKWIDVFEKTNTDYNFYSNRDIPFDEILPWDHISVGVDKQFLIDEMEKALKEKTTPDCRSECMGCGAHALGCDL